jgi:hypothetical protein
MFLSVLLAMVNFSAGTGTLWENLTCSIPMGNLTYKYTQVSGKTMQPLIFLLCTDMSKKQHSL